MEDRQGSACFCDSSQSTAVLTTARLLRTQIAADALGMDHSDPRGFTVTGGLPYYGQFACSAGALVRMVELLREDREAFGLVTGNGAQPDASACFAGLRCSEKLRTCVPL